MKIFKTTLMSLITLLSLGCMNSRQETIKRNATPEKFFDGKDLLMAQAIYKSDLKTIERLIQVEGYNVNTRGFKKTQYTSKILKYTFLGYAVKIGEVKSAKKLLELGADPDLINDEGGLWSNINLAANRKNKELIDLLIQYKADLNPILTGSPIDELLTGDVDTNLIELFLKNGADINHPNFIMGTTALHTAFKLSKFDVVNYLLDRGADPLQLDYSSNSLATLVQKRLDEGRLNAGVLNAAELLKERLERDYGIQFPVKREFIKSRTQAIVRYENLSQEDKDFLGPSSEERIRLMKEGMKKYREDHKDEVE